MIPIKLNNSNISLANLHIEKTESLIRESLYNKKISFTPATFEYIIFDWLEWNLSLILKSETIMLRTIINSFNNFIDNNIINMTWHVNDYTIATKEQLKQVCRDNQISGFSNKNIVALINIISNGTLFNYTTINQIKFKKFKKYIEEVFETFYENKWDNIIDYNRYDFVKKHDIKTCPYCNRGYIFIAKTDEGKLRPEIDHFFPKSIYPYLAMSFYNLIPSCTICNHTKKNRDTYIDQLLSPYEIDYNTSKFTYKLNNLNFYQIKKQRYDTNLKSFDIKFNNTDIENIDKYFKLNTLYKQHKDIVLELLIKRTEYPKSYIDDLKRKAMFTLRVEK